MKDIVVFTDGSCSCNGKAYSIGGIGIHFPDGELDDISSAYNKGSCTNQRAELYAILIALRYIKKNLDIENYRVYVKTDSKYSIDCITKWTRGWIQNGWKTKNNTDVMNRDLIENIYKYYVRYKIFLLHVESHTGKDDSDSIANAVADRLAVKGRNSAKCVGSHKSKVSGSKTIKSKKRSESDKKNHRKFSTHRMEIELVENK